MPVFQSSPPRRIYERNQLKLVVCQLRFPVLQQFETPGFLAPFQGALQDEYPRSSREQQLGITVGPGGATSVPSQQHWRFSGLDDGWSVALGSEFVNLETTSYDRFESFRDRLERVLVALQILGVRVRERLGLRYVNEIRDDEAKRPEDWARFIDGKFLGMVGSAELGQDVIHALQDIRLRDDGDVMVIRHGYVGPQPEAEKCFYLLDIDVFDERPAPFEPAQTVEQLQGFHEKADSAFESSISDELRAHLGIREQVNA